MHDLTLKTCSANTSARELSVCKTIYIGLGAPDADTTHLFAT